ncbi:hypothetical protein AO843_17860 [Lysinibacillus sp. ZYM-1]|nr:hypothetical protein AO843_17860 [Lysinibacillus sp. ZYM-1]
MATENVTHYAILLTLGITGMRKGELAALTWKDNIDFEGKTISISIWGMGVRNPKHEIAFALSIGVRNSQNTWKVLNHGMWNRRKYMVTI